MFQSTLPRRERRAIAGWPYRCKEFQSTLPRRERHDLGARNSSLPGGFNPRSRVGSDVSHVAEPDEATCFNPRSRVGSDPSPLIDPGCWVWFQSTLPRRERLLPLALAVNPEGGFNPRSRVGSDSQFFQILLCSFGFNPRSRVGSDKIALSFGKYFAWFQSTLPRRERRAPYRPNCG